jgi:hypothetical protein
MNWEECEGKQSWAVSKYQSAICLGGTGEINKKLSQIINPPFPSHNMKQGPSELKVNAV